MAPLLAILGFWVLCQQTARTAEGASTTALVPEDVMFQEAKCVEGNNVCVMELVKEFPKTLKKPSNFQVKNDVNCNIHDDVTEVMTCCHALVSKLNNRLHARDPETSVFTVLRNEKCTRIYCDNDDCEYIGCSVDSATSCTETDQSPITPTSSTEGSRGGGQGTASSSSSPSSTQAPSALTGDQGATSTIIIVVSCLVTFLAGLGGGALFWLCRRRRAAKGSETAVASNGSMATIMRGEDNVSLYEELPDDIAGYTKPATKCSTVSISEYSYIPEQTSPLPTYSVISADEDVTSPAHYSEPGDHLNFNRKLPPAPSSSSEQALVASRSADTHGVNPTSPRTQPSPKPQAGVAWTSYSLAQPLGEDGTGQERAERTSPAFGYFILEEVDTPTPSRNRQATTPLIPAASLQQGKKNQAPSLSLSSSSGQQIRSAVGKVAAGNGDGGYYSTLQSPTMEEVQNTQYTALTAVQSESGSSVGHGAGGGGGSGASGGGGGSGTGAGIGAGHPDYLEILPEYCLQKPIN